MLERLRRRTADRSATADAGPPADLRVLIVATLGGGGIHRYAEEQYDHLQGHLDADLYDMRSAPGGSGLAWLLASVFRSLGAALRFPFASVPDVAHVHTSVRFSFYRAAFYVLFAKYVWRRPVVLHVHGSSFDEFVEADSTAVAALQSVVFEASDHVIVLSEYWRETLSAHVPPEKITVVPNAVNPDQYAPRYDHDVPHVVYLSNLVERKGVAELAGALDRVLRDVEGPVEVTVAGTGPFSEPVERLAADHAAVTYRGYVSETEKRRLLSEASIFVLPTYAEGLPIAMLEAMAGGNAIVSTPVGSIPEVISTENGRLVPPGDEDALAAALGALVEEPARVAEMGRRNRELAEERYAWGTAVEDLLDVYADRSR
jgi:glycosyltransferase involved in cell wall biosynthesis